MLYWKLAGDELNALSTLSPIFPGCVDLRFGLDSVEENSGTLAKNQISIQRSAAGNLFAILGKLPSSHMHTVTAGLHCSAH